MSGWLVLALGAPTNTLALRKKVGENPWVGIPEARACHAVSSRLPTRGARAETLLQRETRPCDFDFLLET